VGTTYVMDFARDGLAAVEVNSAQWRLHAIDGQACLAVVGNTREEHIHGKAALLHPPFGDGALEAELRFLESRNEAPDQGWFGVILRARDTENYEMFWFMPHRGPTGSVAYVPVAHGMVPWWTEAYATQRKGDFHVPKDRWFGVRAEVAGKLARIYADGGLVLEKTLTYYLGPGRAGFYVGTLTDAAFRNARVTVHG